MSIAQQPQNLNNKILDQLDLAEWECEYHWSQFEELTLEAQRHLESYDTVMIQRRELSRQVSRVLAGAVVA